MEWLPLVSVIMPVYNWEKYIQEALISIFQQTYQNMNIIIADDGSSDSTKNIVDEFQNTHQTDNKITIVSHQENRGISHALNNWLEAANGKYIAILDHDDKWLNQNKIEEQVSFLENNANYGIIWTDTLVDIWWSLIKNHYPTEDEEIRNVILGKCPMLHSSVLYNKELANEVWWYNNSYRCAVDYDLFLRILKESKWYNLQDNMTYYRIHNENISCMRTKEQKRNALKITRENRHNFPNLTKALIYRTWSVIASTLLPNTDCFKKVQLLIKSNY